MNSKKLKYDLTTEEVHYLLQALNRIQTVGVQQAEMLLKMVDLFKKPLNSEELEKEQLEQLKQKYEAKKNKK